MKSKRLLLLLLMALMAPWAAVAQNRTIKEIGTGTSSGYYTPIGTYYNYSFTQQLYTAEEIGAAGTINSIAFNYASSTAKDFPIVVYMKAVNDANLTSGFVSLSADDQVFSGTLSVTGSGWQTITLPTGFEYDGSQNLLIAIDKGYVYYYSGDTWYYTSATGMARYYQNDNTDPDPLSPPSGTVTANRPNIRIDISVAAGACMRPSSLVCTDYTTTTATLGWTPGNDETNWVLQYSTDNTFATGVQSVNVSNTPSKQLTDLTAETIYYARVRPDCDETLWSNTCEFKPTAAKFIGNGTSTGSYTPLVGNYKSSYDQMIYTASQLQAVGINAAGSITKIGFNSSAANTYARNVKIYMGHTDKTSFSGNTDFIAYNDLQLVYDYTVHSQWSIIAGWNDFELDTPFDYDGSSNLVIAVHCGLIDNYSTSYFYYTATSSNQVVYAYSDSYDPVPGTFDPSSYSGSKATTTQLPNLKLFIEITSTPKPRNLEVSNITSSSAQLQWEAPTSATPTGYQYQYMPDGGSWTALASTSSTSVGLSNLTASTHYTFKVQATYSEGESEFVETDFTTLDACAFPTNLAVTLTYGDGTVADFSWTKGYDEDAWILELATDADFNTITNTITTGFTAEGNQVSYHATGLIAETIYYARVKANCGDAQSNPSEAVTFRPTNFVDYMFGEESVTSTTSTVPIYGSYVNYGTLSQFIIPAADLVDIAGGTIRKMTFHSSTQSANWGDAQFSVYVKEVDATTFSANNASALEDWSTMTQVYSGTLTLSDYAMVVEFNEDFNYNGGNLMIGFNETTTGTSSSVNWHCVSGYTNATLYYYASSWSSYYNLGSNLPQITFNYLPSPYKHPVINEEVCTFGTNTAHIEWSVTSATPTGYQYQYKLSSATDWPTAWESTTNNNADLSDLTAATFYDFRVKAIYGENESVAVGYSFHTECATVGTFPYTENFDMYTTGNNVLPLCWSYINECTYSTYATYPKVSNAYYNSASSSLYFFSYYSSYTEYDPQPQYAILPEMSNLAGKEVVLYARCYSSYTSSTFKIGTMSDPDDASTFDLINEQTGLTTSYQKFSYIIPADCTNGYLAIMIDAATSSRTSNGVYIDDITVKVPVTVDADEIVAANPGEGQMTWSQFVQHWNNGDHFTSTTFTLKDNITITEMVGTAENPFTGTFDGDGKTITANITSGETAAAPFHYIKDATIKNLTMTGTVTETATTSDGYHAGGLVGYAWSGYNIIENCRVSTNVTIAGYGGGIVGHGKTSVVFLKGCVYDGTITNALNVDGNNKGVGGLVGWFDGGAALNIHDSYYNGTYTENEGVSVYFHPVACKTGGASVTVNIYDCYYTCDNPAADSDGTNNVVTNAGQKAYTVTGAEGITVDLPAATIHYSCSGIYGDNNATWNGIKIGDDIYGGEGVTLALSLSGANGYEADHGTLTPISTTYTLLMEAYNTTISGVDCPVPYNVEVSNVEARSAEVTWTGASDTYTLGYAQAVETTTTYDFEDNAIPTEFTNSASYAWTVAEGGANSSNYCIIPGNQGTNSSTSDLTLQVNLTTDATISFWAKISSENSDYGRFLIDGTQKLSISGTSNYTSWTRYEYELTAGSHTLVWRYVKDYSVHSGDDCFYIDDITITSLTVGSWTPIDNIAASPYTIENLTPETAYFVRVRGNCGSTETEYSDMVSFTTPASCIVPTGLAVSDVTTNSAYASWTAGGSETQYVVAYKKATDAEWTEVENRVDQTSYTLSNLDPATDYEVKVQAYCDADDQSDWTEVVSFTTECAAVTVTAGNSFFEDFEEYTGTTYNGTSNVNIPTCWENYSDNTSGYVYAKPHILSAGVQYNFATSGQVLYFYGSGNGYAMLPEFTNPLNELAISFKYATESNSYGTLTLGYITEEDENYNTFTAIEGGTFNASSASDDTFVDVGPIVLSSLPATASRLVFRWYYNGQWGANVDDVEVSLVQTFTKNITGYGTSEKGGYYLIASPLAGQTDAMDVQSMINTNLSDFDLYRFDQQGDDEGKEWINWKGDGTAENLNQFNLESGKGYLYANKNTVTLSFTGVPYSGNGQVTLSKEEGSDFAGLNLVGNPFSVIAYPNKAFYVLNSNGDAMEMEVSTRTSVEAMEGIFVVAENDGETMTFSTTAPESNGGALNINAMRQGSRVDLARVRFGSNSSLPKMQLNPRHTKVYIPQESKDYAVVSAQGEVGEMPVSFKAEENGTYTLSFTNEEVSFSYLHLIDNMTGADVDLLANPTYSFDARTTDYESRFRLVFATGSSVDGDSFGFINGMGNLTIFGIEGEATLQVIDVTGRMLSSETFSGSYEKRLNVAPGVYMLRLINGNDVKVQKMVVR